MLSPGILNVRVHTISDDEPAKEKAPRVKIRRRPVDSYQHCRTRQVLAYFQANPEEWRSYEDMATKFDCTVEQAKIACMTLVDAGMAERESVLIVRLKPCVVEPKP